LTGRVKTLQEIDQASAGSTLSASSHSKVRRALQRVFSFPTMLASVLIVLAVLTVRARFDDPDMWWHLKMGEIIWTTHTIPVTDVFSYTTNHQASIPQEWLAQVSIYGAYRFCGGFSGLMLWVCVFASALLIAGYFLCSLYSGNSKVAFVGALTIWYFSTVGLAVRPQMIGYLFLIVELILIQLGRTSNARWFFCLPILFAVWINCHSSFVLGLIVAGVFLFSSFFNFRLGSLTSTRWDSQLRWRLSLALVLSVPALFLNPVGIKQVLYPVDTILHQNIGLGNVDEWQPTQMTSERGIALMAVLLCILLLAVIQRSDLFWDELLFLAVSTWLGVSHVRLLFAFGILIAPILSRQLSTLWEAYDPERDRIWPNAAFIGLSMLVVVLAFPNKQNLQSQVEQLSPVKAVEFIKSSHMSGPMLNEYGYGGYLIWALPEHPVFVDGRGDVFEWSGVLSEFGSWATLQSDPNLLLQKYKINFCLLGARSPMTRVLPLLHEWKIVYSDNNAVIFVRTAVAGQER
jgi:hypothetical protein